MCIADPESRGRSPAPRLTREQPISAEIGLWVESVEARAPLEQGLAALGFRLAGYLVDETVYTDYGENRHAAPRDWPDGERSPGIVAVTLLERPERLSQEEWMRRWHGTMSPVSEAIQPRTRYVRNVVLQPLTPDAPDYEGIVEEAWPSKRHIANPFLFYGASGPWKLCRNVARILRAVTSFLTLWRIRTTLMSEYLVKTDRRVERARRSRYDV